VGIVGRVSPRLRVSLVVAAAAAAAAGATVGATVLTSSGSQRTPGAQQTEGAQTARPRSGAPPLVLDLGLRTDPEAVALRRAAALYDRGQRRRASPIFVRYHSAEATIGAALADWPAGFSRLQAIARDHPRSALVLLHLGLGLYWQGRDAEARAAWRRAKRSQPDTRYAVRASDLLHPEDPIPDLPFFVASFREPAQLARLSPPRQLAFLAARARAGTAHDKILYGVALQRLGRPISAERQLTAAAALAPHDPEARAAAAVGLFDKDHPALAFGKLGPLVREFPRAATVRFHLGILLLWLGRVAEARKQLRLARAVDPASPLAREADRFLSRLDGVGAKGGGE
jgi:tetratricopeptide (TPR) repeat protein